MSDPLRIGLYIRAATQPVDEWVDAGATLASLRDTLTAAGRMDPSDRFATREAPGQPWQPVPRSGESCVLKDYDVFLLEGPRQPLTLKTADDKEHRLFVDQGMTLAGLRATEAARVPDDATLSVDGTAVARAKEAETSLSGVAVVKVTAKSEPLPLSLLILAPGQKPAPFDWADGSVSATLEELRQALGSRGSPGPFLNSAGSPIDSDMEPYETVESLGKVEPGTPLRVRFGSALAPSPKDGLGSSGQDTAGAAATIAARAALAERLALRETRDTLALLGGTVSAGAPQDWFDGMERAAQSALLLSFRHLHGLRFVATGAEQTGGPAFELDRSILPALVPLGEAPAIRVVVPATSTRFAAFATESATAESVHHKLGWNVSGGVSAEAGDKAIALKASYSQAETSNQLHEGARLVVRVDYMVARGEIVVDPTQTALAPAILERVRSLYWAHQKAKEAGQADADADRDLRLSAIQAVVQLIDLYGAYVPMRTIFGGKLIYRQERTLQASDRAEELVRQVKAEVEGKVGRVQASAGGGASTEDSHQSGDQQQDQSLEVTMHGGDPALVQTPYRWADSLDHFPWWAPIGFAEVKPLFALLPPADRAWFAGVLATVPEAEQKLSGPLDWRAYVAQIEAARLDQHPSLPERAG